jgi:hypothetical protein
MKIVRRDLELAALFGRALVDEAHRTEVCDLTLSAELMENVHDAADALLDKSGDTRAQQAIVSALTPLTRLVLCMWLVDLGLAAKLSAHALKRPEMTHAY